MKYFTKYLKHSIMTFLSESGMSLKLASRPKLIKGKHLLSYMNSSVFLP